MTKKSQEQESSEERKKINEFHSKNIKLLQDMFI